MLFLCIAEVEYMNILLLQGQYAIILYSAFRNKVLLDVSGESNIRRLLIARKTFEYKNNGNVILIGKGFSCTFLHF